MNLNYHQLLWDKSHTKGLTEQESHALQFSAAIFGHYRAFSQATDKEQKVLIAIWKNNQYYQGYKEYLYKTNQIEKAQYIEEEIQNKKKTLMKEITEAECLGLLDPYLNTLSNSSIANKMYIERVSLDYYLYSILKFMHQFMSFINLGSNNFLSRTVKNRKKFSEALDRQENMTRLSFEEHKTENNEHHIIEMLNISNLNAKPANQKNIVIWFGGRESNYAFATEKIITQVLNMDDVHEVWQVNNRRTSLAANGKHANYNDLYHDAEVAYQYIKALNPDANITLCGYCAGSPMACHVASKYSEKFFSDRSFTSIHNVVNVQLSGENSVFLKILFIITYGLSSIAHILLYLYSFNPRQDEMIKTIPQEKRLAHAIKPKKSKIKQPQDSLTLGTNVSLHKATQIQIEDKEFDTKFIAACQSLLPSEISVSDLLNNYKPDIKPEKRKLLNYCKQYLKDSEYDLLQSILVWHKNRKCYIPPFEQNNLHLDPHIAYSTSLSGRGDPNTSFVNQINIFASISNQEIETPTVFSPNNDAVDTLCQSVKPFAIHLLKSNPSLFYEVRDSIMHQSAP